MPTLSIPYDPAGLPSLDVRLQAQGRPSIDFTGTVSSNAPSTVLSKEAAECLGLQSSDLHEAGTVTVVGVGEVPCWTSLIPIRGQVQRLSAPGDPLSGWGPVFDVNAIFCNQASPLWGRSDFFATFTVAFSRSATPAVFALGY